MTDFNMWTWNNRVFPGIDPLPVRLGDRVRVRMANLTMTNHPIHLHGHQRKQRELPLFSVPANPMGKRPSERLSLAQNKCCDNVLKGGGGKRGTTEDFAL